MNIDSHIYSFQYRLITCYVLLLISLTVFAQSGKERFSGRVIDTETNQPVPFATVRLLALPDSAIRDTDYNALGSYFMVHAILRLNMMGR